MFNTQERKQEMREKKKRNGKSKGYANAEPSEFRRGTKRIMQQGSQLNLHTTTANCIS